MEALVRWPQEDGGLRMPGEFIPIAELSGLIVPLGLLILDKVCAQIAAWTAEGLACPLVAVNLSARQLDDVNFPEQLANLIDRYQVASRYLELEVTESVEVPPESVRMQNIEKLRAMGMRLAIDDFGTGHSSLANLKHFPVSCIKIDRSFVRDVGIDPNDEAIIRAMLAMAKELGLEVVAEGVEEERQLAFLQAHGCERLQGYLLGRPMPAAEMRGLLENG
jgi:EAL domain-containing protein (putative c-di-GMP-specific phosphodiesterase class I)